MKRFLKNTIGARNADRLRGAQLATNLFFATASKERLRHKLRKQRLTVTDLMKFRDGVTLFLAPEAEIAPHFASHCILAKTLEELGHKTLILGCYDLYPRCIVKDSGTIAETTKSENDLACVRCGSTSAAFTKEYGLDVFDIANLIGPEERTAIDAIIASLPSDISTFEFEGFAFGKICAGEAAVSLKTLDFSGDTKRTREIMIDFLRGMLLSYLAMQKLLSLISIKRIVYFSEYSMLLGSVFAGQRVGIPNLCMSHAHIFSNDRGRPTLSPKSAPITYRQMLSEWPDWRGLALRPERVDTILSDSLYRFTGNNPMVYSRARSGGTDELYSLLELRDDRPIVVAFTSSQDEVVANQMLLRAFDGPAFPLDQPFTDHMDWLTQLIERAESKGNYQLIVRVHPREDGNRRESRSSEHLKALRARFDRQFDNVKIIWPRDKVSSYDLMEIADAGTSAWSSTVMEMTRLGVPTAIAFRNYTPMPTGDVLIWAREAQDYFKCLEDSVTLKPDFNRIVAAMRWMSLRLFGHSVDLSDVISDPHYPGLPPYRLPASSKFIEDVLINGKTPLELNHAALIAQQAANSQAVETEAVLRNLRRIIWNFTFGTDRPDYRLYFSEPGADEIPAGYDAAAWSEKGRVTIRTGTTSVTRRSRLMERLIMIANQNAI